MPKKSLPSQDLSTEDTEMIDLGAEDSENSENIDPNVQAEKKSFLSMEIWTCAHCDEKNKSYQHFCFTCMSQKPGKQEVKTEVGNIGKEEIFLTVVNNVISFCFGRQPKR